MHSNTSCKALPLPGAQVAPATSPGPAPARGVTAATASPKVSVPLFGTAVAIIIMNLFAPQTLVGLMAKSLGMNPASSGLIAMVSSLGYSIGLFFLVPLADLVKNRRLVVQMLTVATLAAVGVVFAPNAPALLVLLFILSAASSAIQVLVPAAASMTAPHERGKVIGDIMGGLLVGILLSRPIASFLANIWGWRAFYVFSAVAMGLLNVALAARLPDRAPTLGTTYGKLISSLTRLFLKEPVLLKRSITAAIVMAAFNLFWTAVAFALSGPAFHFGQKEIATFALVGAGGAIVTPLVGRMADKGWHQRVTTYAHFTLAAGFAVAAWSILASSLPEAVRLVGLGLSAILLDVGVIGDQTIGRYLINFLRPEARGRINAIFVGIFFVGGAIGSALSSLLWAAGGWGAICLAGALLALFAFGVHLAFPHRETSASAR